MATITEDGKRLFRARATVREMLRDRGFAVTNPRSESAVDVFAGYLRGIESDYALCITATARRKKNKVVVYFPTEPKLGVKPIRDIVAHLALQHSTHAIIVFKDAITPFACREIDDDIAQTITVETFKLGSLLYNVTHHQSVPAHVVLSRQQRDAYLRDNNVVADKLPKIFAADPVVRYYGLKRGQMVRVERFSPEGHAFTYHRVVT